MKYSHCKVAAVYFPQDKCLKTALTLSLAEHLVLHRRKRVGIVDLTHNGSMGLDMTAITPDVNIPADFYFCAVQWKTTPLYYLGPKCLRQALLANKSSVINVLQSFALMAKLDVIMVDVGCRDIVMDGYRRIVLSAADLVISPMPLYPSPANNAIDIPERTSVCFVGLDKREAFREFVDSDKVSFVFCTHGEDRLVFPCGEIVTSSAILFE